MGVISHDINRFHPHSNERLHTGHEHQEAGILGNILEFCQPYLGRENSFNSTKYGQEFTVVFKRKLTNCCIYPKEQQMRKENLKMNLIIVTPAVQRLGLLQYTTL